MAAETGKKRRGRPAQGVREAILKTTLELIGDQGLARLTTKEIAVRAGVSEASIYYHFADKKALVEGVIIDAVLAPLREFAASFPARAEGRTVREALLDYGGALEAFWKRVLPVLSAVQADAELRDHFQRRINELGFGPHRGVQIVGNYLEGKQNEGLLGPDVNPQAIAMAFAASCFLSAYQGHMLGPAARRKLPALRVTIESLVDLAQQRHR